MSDARPAGEAANQRCDSCGEGFSCGMKAGAEKCWCAELPPVMPVSGDACLCPKCLRAEAEKRVGLCLDCAHARTSATKGGGAVFRCELSAADPAFPRYPRLPVLGCAGHRAK